ncbi:TonB-dependent receptor [Luteimonas sp. BDR2-5]|uniref:TonB-dependent receptor n=1 Tax=Proluteimonas luteida TaxID=2878685 RepID=UPI001E2DE585|nr:TonB-dependent receptor [Luteimonas sp. BDR2-5]MCD9027720.1 TonB-dependent receptor [Luteimonas sp. BDR2-5]
MIRKKILSAAVVVALSFGAQAFAQTRTFDVPAQPAATSIPELARQAGVQIVATGIGLDGIDTPAVVGEMDVQDALRRLLEGTDVEISTDQSGTILVRPAVRGGAGQMQGTGAILGQVFDPVTGGYLRNAIIRLNGRQVTISGERGEFRISAVPAGTQQLTVEYTGFVTASKAVEVRSGETSTQLIELYASGGAATVASAETLDTVEVVGAREGDARAIMEQRASMNITNTLSADSFGEIGDGNPGEFLKYMPGVDFDVVADDAPRNISLRGLPAKYTGVTVNGVSLSGIDAAKSSSRTFSFEQIALSGVESINIYKTTSADMDANAPAGTIDIRTRKAFDRKGRNITVQLGATTHSNLWDSYDSGPIEGGYDKKFLPVSAFNYSDVFLDGRLGVAAGVSSTTNYVEQEQITAGRNYVPTAVSPEPYAVTSISANNYGREYNRRVAQLGLDFKATDQLILSLMTSVSRGDIEPNIINPAFTTNARSRGVIGDPSLDFTTQSAETANTLNVNHTYNYKLGYTRNFIPSFEWNTEHFKLDGNLFSSRSSSRYDSGKKGQVYDLLNPVTSRGNFSASRESWMTQDWKIQQVDGPDWSDPDSFALGAYNGSTRPTVRTNHGSSAELDYRGGSLNFSFYQDIGHVPVTWKTGLKATRAGYDYGNDSEALDWTYTGPLSNAEFLRAIQSDNQFSAGDSGMYVSTLNGGQLYVHSLAKIYQMMQASPEQWTHTITPAQWYDAYVANVREVDESINSLYFMGTAEFTEKLRAQAGLRWEQTRTSSYDFDPLSPEEVVAAGYAVSDGTGRATTIEGLEYQYLSRPRVERKGDYAEFFPSASVKYSFTDSLDLIAGYSKTIQRPEVEDLAGVWSISYDDDGVVLSAPNQNLKPEYSDNFSIRLVKYFEPVGLVSLNYYRNKIKDLISTVSMSPEEFGYDGTEPVDMVTTTSNLPDEINISGYEFEFNHAMDYLPGALKGLTVRGSYTYSDPDVVLPRVATQVANVGLAWRHGPMRLNLNTVWSDEKDRGLTGNIVNAHGETMNQKQPFDDYLEVNLSGSYTIIPKTSSNFMGLEFYFSANNLFNQNRHTVYSNGETGLGEKGHHSQIYIHSGRRAAFGFRGRF